jgi:hypothetical protein
MSVYETLAAPVSGQTSSPGGLMRKSKFTESQIVKTIKDVEGGRPVKSV